MSFANGRIEEFYVACNCLSAEQMAEVEVSRALAAAMSSFHFASLLHLPPEEATDPQVPPLRWPLTAGIRCVGGSQSNGLGLMVPRQHAESSLRKGM